MEERGGFVTHYKVVRIFCFCFLNSIFSTNNFPLNQGWKTFCITMPQLTLTIRGTTIVLISESKIDAQLTEIFFRTADERWNDTAISLEKTISAYEWFKKGYTSKNKSINESEILQHFERGLN